MGQFNSSVTRVWPVFDCLFAQDSTGEAWLKSLLSLGSKISAWVPKDLGPLLPDLARVEKSLPASVRRAVGPERAQRIGLIRNAFECDLPPSEIFLRWLIEHPQSLTWPTPYVMGDQTERKRRELMAGNLKTRAEGLAELALCGPSRSQRKWWAFEGFTSVDCYLETQSLVLLIEGKRTEPVSAATIWYPRRNQLLRNLEVAKAAAGGKKDYAVLLCSECPMSLTEEDWTMSYPHLSGPEIAELKRHYLGYVLWSDIVRHLCPTLTLPHDVDEAIQQRRVLLRLDRAE